MQFKLRLHHVKHHVNKPQHGFAILRRIYKKEKISHLKEKILKCKAYSARLWEVRNFSCKSDNYCSETWERPSVQILSCQPFNWAACMIYIYIYIYSYLHSLTDTQIHTYIHSCMNKQRIHTQAQMLYQASVFFRGKVTDSEWLLQHRL